MLKMSSFGANTFHGDHSDIAVFINYLVVDDALSDVCDQRYRKTWLVLISVLLSFCLINIPGDKPCKQK